MFRVTIRTFITRKG